MDLEMYLWTALIAALIFVIDVGAVIVGGVWLNRRGYLGGRRIETAPTPVEVLERRFAEGALSVDEYHERLAVITTGD